VIVASPASNTLYVRHGDHLGSTSVLSDSSGAKVTNSEVVYAPFGEVRVGSLPTLTDLGFTGQPLDRSTAANPNDGLMYYGARYYLPGLRRFISADSVVPQPFNSQAYNRYSYVLNNPIRLIDPSGHAADDSASGIVTLAPPLSDDSPLLPAYLQLVQLLLQSQFNITVDGLQEAGGFPQQAQVLWTIWLGAYAYVQKLKETNPYYDGTLLEEFKDLFGAPVHIQIHEGDYFNSDNEACPSNNLLGLNCGKNSDGSWDIHLSDNGLLGLTADDARAQGVPLVVHELAHSFVILTFKPKLQPLY